MRAVLGIGNPGKQYHETKHNIGFMILDRLADKHNFNYVPSTNDYFYAKGVIDSFPCFLIKPTTYVNLSGVAAFDFIEKYGLQTNELLVVTDDLNLELGKIRIRRFGGDGGHNGIKSLIYHLQTDEFPRLRFGIGSNFDDGQMADYVLSKFNSEEFNSIKKTIDFSIELVEQFITGGISSMLNYFSKNSTNYIQNKSEGSIK